MKNKLSYLLGSVIGFLLMTIFFYCAWYLMMLLFEKLFPEQTYFVLRLIYQNIFLFLGLIILAELVNRVFKNHKAKHRILLNNLAEIEWIEQYGVDGTK